MEMTPSRFKSLVNVDQNTFSLVGSITATTKLTVTVPMGTESRNHENVS